MNDGVTDEQRVAAFRDRYGRVAFAAAWGTTNPDVPRPRWEDVTEFTRRYWGTVAESVVDAFATGDGAPPNSGTIAVDRARLDGQKTTVFRGVRRSGEGDRWQAVIRAEGRHFNLGMFGTPEEAAVAYDDAARRLHREFARLNFPGQGEMPAVRKDHQ